MSKSRFPIWIIVFDKLELIIFVSQGLTLLTASLVSYQKKHTLYIPPYSLIPYLDQCWSYEANSILEQGWVIFVSIVILGIPDTT